MPLANMVLAQDETITIASAQFVVNPAQYILNSTTIAPGSPAVSIDGQLVSADPSNDLFVNGVEVLTEYPAASPSSSVASASTTAFSSSVVSATNDGSSGSAGSASQSNGIAPGSMSASASGFGLLPTISSQNSNMSMSAISTATGSSDSGSAITSSGSTADSGSSITSSGSTDSILYTGTASSASSVPPSQNADTNSASSSSSIAPGPNANTNSASPASQSSMVASIIGSGSGTATYLSSTGSNTFIQSNYSTGSSASASSGNFLSSNGTTSGLSSLTAQFSSSGSGSAISNTALGSSNPVSSSVVSSIPGSITSGPVIAMPITTVNPTGPVASAAGISLGGLVLGISQEAQTLSAIVTNSASSSSYVLKIQAVESKWDDYFRQIGGDNPPSYDTACTGGGLTGLLKLAGCINSGLDKIKVGIEGIDTNNPGPALTEIEGVIANVAEMAQEEEKEEEEDDDDEQSTQNESQASRTQQSSNTPSNPVSSTTLSSSAVSSSVSPSVSSSAVSSGVMTDPPCDTVMPQALPAGYSIDNGAAEVVLGFVGDILLSVLGGEVSGFTTSTVANSTSAVISSTPVVPSTLSSAVSPQGTTSPLLGPEPGKIATYDTKSFLPFLQPSTTIGTTPTSTAPVIIPGQGGLSPCVEYLSNDQGYAPGTENYCFCDGINAPMRVNIVSGTIVSDCSYTTMPTSGWTPTVTAGYSSSTPPSSTPPSSTPPPPINPALTSLLTPFTVPLVYQCTMIVDHIELGRNGLQATSTCDCNDGGHPTPTPTAKSLACPSQVTSISNPAADVPDPVHGANPN